MPNLVSSCTLIVVLKIKIVVLKLGISGRISLKLKQGFSNLLIEPCFAT